MNKLPLLGFVLGSLLLAGCAHTGTQETAAAPSTVPSDSIRIGDKITVRLTGVPQGEDYINEIQIPESGDITLPDLTQNFHAAGMRPGELADRITRAYKDAKLYTNPNVTVIPEERYLTVGGDVRSPSRPVWTPDMTLLGAINACGGFDEYANKHSVRILRGSKIITVDATTATTTPGADPAVYPGDQITVPRTIL